jgi:class 3 adenylate cyclase/tetratricopeptide (TPR) repeat protein
MEAAPLEIRVLGPLEVRVGFHTVPLRAYKPRALLADLIVHGGEVVSRDRLIDDLWGSDAPASAQHALDVYMSELRKPLPSGVLATHPTGYRLVLDAAQVDVQRFERLLAEGRRRLASGEPEHAATSLREGLALWRGDALADFTYEPFAQTEIARLEELRHEAVELRIDADLALGRSDLVAELESLVGAHPLSERLRGQLMLALYRSGRQADALAVYRATRETLVEELGLEPGPELRALETAIIRQDASIDVLTPAPPARQRKLATILFADVVDSTALGAALDPETLRGVLDQYFEAASAAVARHGGTVEKFVGDAVMAAFGTPVAHEDDALRAVRAAVEIQESVGALDESLQGELEIRLAVRIGLATGEVLAASGASTDTLVTGSAVALAARVQQAVDPGEIAVDAVTYRMTEAAAGYAPLGEIALRGRPDPVALYRLTELLAVPPSFVRRLDVPLVGRHAELDALGDVFRQAVAHGGARAACVVGPAGIGKSRLAAELVDRLTPDATVMAGRCLPYGEDAYGPLREAIGDVDTALEGAPDAVAVAERLAGVLGGPVTPPADEIRWAFRRYCEQLAGRQPVVVAIDDLHWAQPALLELLEHLVARSERAPILVVCLAREELLEESPQFLEGAALIVLEPLDDDETRALAEHLLAGRALAAEMRDRLTAAAEGNPLFLEQLLRYTADTGSLDVPPTLRALLAARLDRLGPGERAVIERAAVVGRDFSLADATMLQEPPAAPSTQSHLDRLARRGFLRTGPSAGVHTFRHGLIQDVAYRTTPKQLRADLHERYAEALAARNEDDELVGHHLEQASRLCAELGKPDLRVALEAAGRLGRAGVRMLKRNDVAAGADLLERARSLEPRDAVDPGLLCELGVALGTAGQADRADAVLGEALAAAQTAGNRAVELRVQIELGARRVLTEPTAAADDFLALAARVLPELEAIGDDRGLGRTWMLAGWVHGGFHCQNRLSADAARRALVHYRRAGWPSSTCVAQLASALYSGPTPVAEASAECETLLSEADDLAGEANVRAVLGGLAAMQGRFDEAHASIREASSLFEDLGHTSSISRICGPLGAAVHLLAGDAPAAEAVLRESCAVLRRIHDRSPLATQAAELAETIYLQGRHDEAEHWTVVAAENATIDDVDAQCLWRSVRAKVLARSGATKAGEAMAREAVGLSEPTDALNRRALLQLNLAEVLRIDGRIEEGAQAAEAAASLFDLKGNVVAAEQARSLGEIARV